MAGLADTIFGQVTQWVTNFQRNATHMFDGMEMKNYIRLIAIVGAYALLRPYLLKLGAKIQAKEHEKMLDPQETGTGKAAISPNSLRGMVEVPDDSESDGDENGEEGKKTGADWGKKARRRQRNMVRKILDAEEKLRREQEEDEDDKDIMEYLDDYKEGWD